MELGNNGTGADDFKESFRTSKTITSDGISNDLSSFVTPIKNGTGASKRLGSFWGSSGIITDWYLNGLINGGIARIKLDKYLWFLQ